MTLAEQAERIIEGTPAEIEAELVEMLSNWRNRKAALLRQCAEALRKEGCDVLL